MHMVEQNLVKQMVKGEMRQPTEIVLAYDTW